MNFHPDFSSRGYQVKELLGQNFVSGRITYRAVNIENQQSVVIKQFQFSQPGSNWSRYRDIQQEITVLKMLDHSNIPRYIDSFETDTSFCLVQEYKQATSLNKCRQLTLEEIKKVAVSILEILVYLQQQNPPIIHRDIKPENILVEFAENTENTKLYLVDFGFARHSNHDIAYSSVIKGTLGFMPPEQIFNRQLTKASDLYSLGATLICLIANIDSNEIGTLVDENYRFKLEDLQRKVDSKFLFWLKKVTNPKVSDRYQNAKDALISLKTVPTYISNLELGYSLHYFLFRKQFNFYTKFTIPITVCLLTCCTFLIYNYSKITENNQRNITFRHNRLKYLHEQGLLMTELEKHEEAITFLDKAISIDPNVEVSWYHKGVSLREIKKYKESIATFKKLQKISPNWSYSWLGEATTLSLMNKEEEGLIAIEKALKLDPNDSHIWVNKGFILMRLKRYKEAQISFEKALSIEPNNPYARRKLIEIKKGYHKSLNNQ